MSRHPQPKSQAWWLWRIIAHTLAPGKLSLRGLVYRFFFYLLLYMCAFVRKRKLIRWSRWVCVRACVRVCARVCARAHVCVYAVCMFQCVCVRVNVWVHACLCVPVHARLCGEKRRELMHRQTERYGRRERERWGGEGGPHVGAFCPNSRQQKRNQITAIFGEGFWKKNPLEPADDMSNAFRNTSFFLFSWDPASIGIPFCR